MSVRDGQKFEDHLAAVAALAKVSSIRSLPALICVVGDSAHLQTKVAQKLRSIASSFGENTFYRLESKQIDADFWEQTFLSASMFEEASLYLVWNNDKGGYLAKALASVKSTSTWHHRLVINFTQSPSAGFLKDLNRLNATFIPCFTPTHQEMNRYIHMLAHDTGLQLDATAVELLKETQGNDLGRLDNEIGKLALIFAGATKKQTASDLAPHLGVLREDHAFALDDFLTRGERGKAQALLTELLRRGEKPHALLGILALHCRKALKIRQMLLQGHNERVIAQELRLPVPIVKSYNRYVQQHSPKIFLHALNRCQQADVQIKSTPIGDEVILFDVLQELTGLRS